jgi:hypothetical protein
VLKRFGLNAGYCWLVGSLHLHRGSFPRGWQGNFQYVAEGSFAFWSCFKTLTIVTFGFGGDVVYSFAVAIAVSISFSRFSSLSVSFYVCVFSGFQVVRVFLLFLLFVVFCLVRWVLFSLFVL